MEWNVIWAQALAYMIAKFGPGMLDAIGNLFLAIIKSLTPQQQQEVAKAAGVEENIINEVWSPRAV